MLSDIKSAIDVARTSIGMARERGTIAAYTKADALEALMKAISATRQYVSKAPERSGEFDMKAENELTNLRIAASQAAELIDSDRAERCFMKAYGWAE